MKVLQVNCVYPNGSTGKIVYDLHNELIKNGHESIVCFGNGKKINSPHVYKFSNVFLCKINALLRRISGLMYGGCFIATLNLISIIKSNKPDIVHLHCINGNIVNIYKLISWLNKNNFNVVLTLHAEFMHTANCSHAYDCMKWLTGCGNCSNFKSVTNSFFFDNTNLSWKKMKKAFLGFKNIEIVSVSPWLMDRAKKSPILSNLNHSVILNGLNLNVFKNYECDDLRNDLELAGKKIIFHATPYFDDNPEHLKGGYYVLKLADMLKNENVHFLVAGNYNKNIIIPKNMTMLGNVSDQILLAKYYSLSDLFLLTSKAETFSMTTAESLCCGTPVFGFKAGAPEQICLNECCKFVDYGDINSLFKYIKVELNNSKKENINVIAGKKYSKEIMYEKYFNIYNKLLKK